MPSGVRLELRPYRDSDDRRRVGVVHPSLSSGGKGKDVEIVLVEIHEITRRIPEPALAVHRVRYVRSRDRADLVSHEFVDLDSARGTVAPEEVKRGGACGDRPPCRKADGQCRPPDRLERKHRVSGKGPEFNALVRELVNLALKAERSDQRPRGRVDRPIIKSVPRGTIG